MARVSSIQIVQSRDALRRALDEARARKSTVGFVPTMGALHEGHLKLCEEARSHASFVVVSIFVNPTQFGPQEDLARYPRDLQGDLEKCERAAVDLVFAPPASEMYPPGDATRVTVVGLTDGLCGPFRSRHFEGVATVVAKLFALTAPCVALFGRKDYQQLKVIERMTRDLLFPVEVRGIFTVRDVDGLAQSSRNTYLSSEERERARAIPRGLGLSWRAFAAGERRVGALREMVQKEVAPAVDSVDYITVADADTLVTLSDDTLVVGRALIALAVRVGKTRLIDNLVWGEDSDPWVRQA